jgi:hypothetical protein
VIGFSGMEGMKGIPTDRSMLSGSFSYSSGSLSFPFVLS